MKPAAANKPIGRLTQKTQGQEKYWTIKPPAKGPTTAEIAQTLARYPWILARSCAV